MIDSHIHLDAKAYVDAGGVEQILQSAAHVGVDRMVAPALHLDSFEQLLSLSREFPQIFPAVGVHPHEASVDLAVGLAERLVDGLGRLEVPILGETGLEGHYDFIALETQLACLRPHLDVAKVHNVPLILHSAQPKRCFIKN